MFSFFKSTKAKRITRPKALTRYNIVSGDSIHQREPLTIETKNEYELLDANKRLKFINACRQAVRNSPSINALLQNIQNCVIGDSGYKLIWSGAENDEVRKLKNLFREYTRDCGFFGRENFRTILALVLKSIIISGDCCLVFDQNQFRASGKILLWESDEICNISQEDFEKVYGKQYQQILGVAVSQFGEECGIILSKSQRGKETFDVNKSYCLKADVTKPIFDQPYLHVKWMPWRVNQIRGISPLASSIACAYELDSVCENEIAVSRKASQLLAQIYDTKEAAEEPLPSAFSGEDLEGLTDEQIKQIVQAEQTQTVGFQRVQSVGAQVIQMPDGKRLEALDFQHPNMDIVNFIRLLQDRVTAPLGIAGFFATYNPSSDSSKLAMQMSWQTFGELQKQLEQVADYVFFKFVAFCGSKGLVDVSRLPENWMHSVKWSHPSMANLDPVANENANRMKLQSLTGSYQDILGNDWQAKLEQIKIEQDYLKANGLPQISYGLLTGGESVVLENQQKEKVITDE